jgi:3-hexulose-6-phosphate synthase / 6-phospho-3-hexuloisomerase
MKNPFLPTVQIALDFLHLKDALYFANIATSQGIDWLEAGTPLIKSEGMNAIRSLCRKYPNKTVVADMKTLDAGAMEAEMAVEAGANVVSVSGLAHDKTIRDSVRIARNHDSTLMADLLMAANPKRRAKQLETLGVDIVCLHTGIDAQIAQHSGMRVNRTIHTLARSLRIPVAAAGGIDPTIARRLVNAGVKVVIVGGWITRSKNPARAARQIVQIVGSVQDP